jgi:hypothetical protein
MRLRIVPSTCAALLLCTLAGTPATRAAEWDLVLDVLVVDSDGRESFLEGGQGKLRFDEDHEGLRLGRLRGSWSQPLGNSFSIYVDASSWADHDKNFIDLTEAYVAYNPPPRAGLHPRLRLGAFFAPTSLENRVAGWETPYTITPSAISAWIGEELRTIGLEGQLDWSDAHPDSRFELSLTGALFGWNDPAGTLIAAHGFALHDRQTTLFGRVGEPVAATVPKRELFHEIDHRAGFYARAQASYLERVVLNVLHYDNRADPAAFSPSLRAFAWDTKFDTAGVRVDTDNGWSVLAQWLDGETYIAPRGVPLEWELRSYSALLAKSLGPHLLSVRYDDFEVEHEPEASAGNEDGHAWAVAYSLAYGESWRFTLEWLRVKSDVAARPIRLGEPALATETAITLAVRYALSGSTAASTGRVSPRD